MLLNKESGAVCHGDASLVSGVRLAPARAVLVPASGPSGNPPQHHDKEGVWATVGGLALEWRAPHAVRVTLGPPHVR